MPFDGTEEEAEELTSTGVPRSVVNLRVQQIVAPPHQSIQDALRPRTSVYVLTHSLYLCGLGGFVYGSWLAWHPAGYLVGGGLLVVLAWLIDGEESKRILDKFGRRPAEED